LAVEVGDLKRFCLLANYLSQASLLEKLHQGQQPELFVAQYQILENRNDGSLISYCTWVKGIDILLPQTDWVALVMPDAGGEIKDSKMVAWADLQAMVGQMMQPQEGYPLRYRVDSFPSAEQIGLLRAV
jgi:hypothetical protein